MRKSHVFDEICRQSAERGIARGKPIQIFFEQSSLTMPGVLAYGVSFDDSDSTTFARVPTFFSFPFSENFHEFSMEQRNSNTSFQFFFFFIKKVSSTVIDGRRFNKSMERETTLRVSLSETSGQIPCFYDLERFACA